MNREGHENTNYFIGPEVEHTPAYSKKTLFVVGKQPVTEIENLARLHKAPHIYMGANHSFTGEADPYWDETITTLLDKGFWVSFDYQAHQHVDILKMLNPGVWQSRIFVPVLSVRIPKIENSNPNLTVKIDDIDFKATNPGVWCMHFHELTDSNRFTDWNDYSTDMTVSFPKVKVEDVAGSSVSYVVHKEPEKTVTVIEPSAPKVETPVQNDASIGLDPDSPSQLKADPDEEVKNQVVLPEGSTSKQEVADLYADATSGAAEKPTTKKKK